ncbi:MAG: hypothetical protein GF347_03150, partial [Candidatus Moranbacteria bacterium]|nr:hypothetical protein [Candidatus Moranbacteria bacterium]
MATEKIQTVWIAVPFYKNIESGTQDCLDAMLNYENLKIQQGIVSEYTFIHRRKEGTNKSTVSREAQIQDALDYGADWILWIDSDMTFPKYTLEEMWANRKKNGIVGAYCVWRKEPHFPTCGRMSEDGFMLVNWFNRKLLGSGLHIQDATGMGVTMVDMDVYRKMEPKGGDSPAMIKAVESILKDADDLNVEEAIKRIDDANGYWGWYLTDSVSGTLKSYDGREIRVKNRRMGNDYAFCVNAKRHHDVNCYLLSTPKLPYVGHIGEQVFTPHDWYGMLEFSEKKLHAMLNRLKSKDKWNFF